LPIEEVQASSHVVLAVTPSGGHLGWFDGPFAVRPGSDPKKTGYPQQRWIVKPVSEFLQAAVDALEPEAVRGHAETSKRSVERREDGWEWVRGSEDDTYGRVGWKEVFTNEHVKGAESSGVLQGL
jgi:hypothetical protein